LTGADGVGALLAFAIAAALAGAIAATGPIDTVKARSSHKRPTPTGAGLGLLTATVAGTALAGGSAPSIAVVLACAAGLGLFGAADDLLDLGAGPKLLAQAGFAALLVTAAAVTALPLWPGLAVPLGPWLGGAGSVLFLVVLVNAYNFTDGADGLLGGAAVVAGVGLALAGVLLAVPEVTTASAAFVAAALGFLPWNLRHRVFQGDVGAFFSALVVGGLGLVLAARGAATPFLVVFTALPLITDVLLTLVVRARRRERLFEAHHDHLYQLWLRSTGRPHLAVAVRVWALTALTTGTGLMLEVYARDWAFAGLLATVALLSAGWLRLRAQLASALPRTAEAGAPTADRQAGAAGTDTWPNRPE
jgi:UDP-N-acetylmuramyl pentapeptide phosphotransferase/UDP-N-acetylglucosamine-1-phosphate transferase